MADVELMDATQLLSDSHEEFMLFYASMRRLYTSLGDYTMQGSDLGHMEAAVVNAEEANRSFLELKKRVSENSKVIHQILVC